MSILTGLKVWSLACKCLFYKSEHNAREEGRHVTEDINPWRYRVLLVFADSAVFYIFTLNISQTEPYHFLKPFSIPCFKCTLNVLPKLWLIFCCRQQKIQKMCHFFHFCISRPSKFSYMSVNMDILFLHKIC